MGNEDILIRSRKCTPFASPVHPRCFRGVHVANLFIFVVVVLLCILPFLVPCCDVRYDSLMKTMFGSFYLQLFVGGLMSYCVFLCMFAYSDVQHFVLSNAFTFWVPWCDVHCDFRIKNEFCSSLHPVVCRRSHFLFTLFCVCLCILCIGVSNTYCVVFCFSLLFVFVLCLVYPMLSVSLDYPYLIAPPISS